MGDFASGKETNQGHIAQRAAYQLQFSAGAAKMRATAASAASDWLSRLSVSS